MAVIRNPSLADSSVNYIATLAFFGCMSCMVLMLKFRGFRASLNLSGRSKEEELAPAISITGSYRMNRDEFYGNGSLSDPPKKFTPSMVKLPPSASEPVALRNAKSTSDLVQTTPEPPKPSLQPHRSTNDVSSDPRGGTSSQHNRTAPAPPPPERKRKKSKNEEREQKKLEKQRLAEVKAREKAAAQEQAKEKAREKAEAQEQAKQEKLRREKEKKEAQEKAKIAKMNKKKKKPAPAPQMVNPLANVTNNPAPPPPPDPSYSTNTLDSSISKSSGPPPYDETNNQVVNLQNSNPTDVSFGKSIGGSDSWDMISRHRQQLNRPVSSGLQKNAQKNMVMDLNYTLGSSSDNVNTDA